MKKIIFLVGFLLVASVLHAQQNYAVKIADSKTEDPLDKACVIIKSTKQKAVTNETGLLVIQASPGDVLIVSRAGYTTQEATLSASSAVHVFLAIKKKKKK